MNIRLEYRLITILINLGVLFKVLLYRGYVFLVNTHLINITNNNYKDFLNIDFEQRRVLYTVGISI